MEHMEGWRKDGGAVGTERSKIGPMEQGTEGNETQGDRSPRKKR